MHAQIDVPITIASSAWIIFFDFGTGPRGPTPHEGGMKDAAWLFTADLSEKGVTYGQVSCMHVGTTLSDVSLIFPALFQSVPSV